MKFFCGGRKITKNIQNRVIASETLEIPERCSTVKGKCDFLEKTPNLTHFPAWRDYLLKLSRFDGEKNSLKRCKNFYKILKFPRVAGHFRVNEYFKNTNFGEKSRIWVKIDYI